MSGADSKRKVAILTGATGQIGKEIAFGLAEKGLHVVLAVRNTSKGDSIAADIRKSVKDASVEVEHIDLASLSSITEFTTNYAKRKNSRVDVLVNNAAIVPERRQINKDGLELQFATNVLSYFLLGALLRPLLRQTAQVSGEPSRIVNVASQYAGGLNLEDLHFQRRPYSPNVAYKQSKQANRLLSWQAAERFKDDGIIVHACHPGVVTSNLLSGLGMGSGWDSPQQAASTPVYLATAPAEKLGTGKFWKNQGTVSCSFRSDSKTGEALWNYCSQLHSKLKAKPSEEKDQ